MIHLDKGPKPQILHDNADMWKEDYLRCLESGGKPDKLLANTYNHPTVKQALEKETFEKCAYCESKIKHIDHGDIDHILPKNKNARPDLCFEWSNLTLACTKCNRSGKRDYFNEGKPLINPYVDYPEDHFIVFGPFIWNKDGDERAYITVKTLELDTRPGLIEARNERIKSIRSLFALWEKAEPSSPAKALAENELHNEYSKDKEYSFIVKVFLNSQDFPVKKETARTYAGLE